MNKLEKLKAAYDDAYAAYNDLPTLLIIASWVSPYHAASVADYAQRVADTARDAYDAYNAYRKEFEKQND